jgi:CheY-like chemotaxis protein
MKTPIEQTSHHEIKPRILIIEDEPALSRVLSLVLKGGGFNVRIAATGTDGLRLSEEQTYDLILSDIELPDMDGSRFARELNRTLNSRLCQLFSCQGGWPRETKRGR